MTPDRSSLPPYRAQQMPRFFHFPWQFPPSGPLLFGLCALYLLPGLIGHDPWKSYDATHFGVVYSMLRDGAWLQPELAGEPYYDFPPLYYWLGAALGKALDWLLPLHDAVRLASAALAALMAAGMAAAAEELYGAETRGAAILVIIGCLGLLVPVHDAQPLIALLSASAWTYAGLAVIPRAPLRGAVIGGLGVGLGALAGGPLAVLLLAPLFVLLPLASRHWRAGASVGAMVASLLLATFVAASWPTWLWHTAPERFDAWWARQLYLYVIVDQPLATAANSMSTLSWFAWPALPLAAWVVWRERKSLGEPGVLLPLLAFAIAFVVLSATQEERSVPTLALLTPLALLATAGAGSLRRGAANALDWFAMMTFTFFAALVWVGWAALAFGVPERLARQAARLEPGFVMPFQPLALACAVLLSVGWLWLIFASPKSPYRGTVHWAAGICVFWGLLSALWLPWIDYGKSYRPLSASLAEALPRTTQCIIGRGLGEPQRASFHYFAGIKTRREGTRGSADCRLLLVQETGRRPEPNPGRGWKKLWEGRRAGDRNEMFRLYRRER